MGGSLASVALTLCLILGLTLVVAGVGKLRDLTTFVAGVQQYRVLPPRFARWYGRILPLAELGIGILLLAGTGVRVASVLAVVMFSSFAVAVALNLVRKRKIPCFCFGADASTTLGWHTLTRILLLLVAAFALILMPTPPNMWQSIFTMPSVTTLVPFLPVILLTIFGLFVLSFIEVAPLIVTAWTAPAVKMSDHQTSVVWTCEAIPQEGAETRL